jgi:ornithine cyclodeaminase
MGQVSERYKARFGDRARIVAHDNPAAATKGADIVITATPSNKPLIDLDAVSPGAHVNAMGCDSKGKREIGGELLAKATRFVDSAEQARGIGEHQYAPDLDVTEIGTLLAGVARRARTEGEITLFDSTGVAFQDLASARQIYELALSQGKGQRIDWPT